MKHTSFPTKGEKRKFEKTYSYTPAADQINESNCDKLSIEALQGERGELNSELERVRRLYDDIAEQVTDLQSENQRLTEDIERRNSTYLDALKENAKLILINEELVKALKEIYSEAVSISDRNRKSVIQDIAWNALEPTKPLNHEQS